MLTVVLAALASGKSSTVSPLASVYCVMPSTEASCVTPGGRAAEADKAQKAATAHRKRRSRRYVMFDPQVSETQYSGASNGPRTASSVHGTATKRILCRQTAGSPRTLGQLTRPLRLTRSTVDFNTGGAKVEVTGPSGYARATFDGNTFAGNGNISILIDRGPGAVGSMRATLVRNTFADDYVNGQGAVDGEFFTGEGNTFEPDAVYFPLAGTYAF